jgi:hypothetical protein
VGMGICQTLKNLNTRGRLLSQSATARA